MAEISVDSIKDKSAFRSVAALTLDKRWYQLITDEYKTDEIRFWEGRLNELLKRQGQITNDIRDVKKIKSQLIQDVVENMEDDNNDKKHKKMMDQSQKLIVEAKEKIANLEDEELELPRQIADANEHLMIETAKVCFAKINANREDLDVLDKWIKAARIKLKRNLLIKQDKENTNEALYSGMHNIFGPEVMSQLDAINDAK